MGTTLRAEFYFDDEANNWHFQVPALYINRGGTATREEAERECLSAIAFALEGDPTDYDHDAQVIDLEVSVAPAA
jgi:hypothetical protein